MYRFPVFAVGWIFIALMTCAGCGHHGAEGKGAAAPKVRVVVPMTRDVTDYEYFTGRTDAVNSVNIQAKVNGYLTAIDFVSGSEVKVGQRLFKIDPRTYQAAYDQAMGQVALAKAQLKLAIADYKRAQEVAKTPGAISQQDVDRYAAAEAEGSASVVAAEANAEQTRVNLGYTDINSPIAGVVGRNLESIGNLVKQDTTLLTTVVSQDPIYVYFDIDDRTMLRVMRLVSEGKLKTYNQRKVPVDIGLADEGDDFPHQGIVDFVNNQIDPNTGTLEVRGTFTNPLLRKEGPRLLKPGLFVRVRLPIGTAYAALLIPQMALGTDQGRKYVSIVNDQDIVEYRPVNVGPQQPGALQVVLPVPMVKTEGGLREAKALGVTHGDTVPSIGPKDRVIVGGLQRVHPGMKVTPKVEEVSEVQPALLPVQPAAEKTGTDGKSPKDKGSIKSSDTQTRPAEQKAR